MELKSKKGNTSLMLFDFGTIIEYVSQFFTLKKEINLISARPLDVVLWL